MADLYEACGRDESSLCFEPKYEPLLTLFNKYKITTAEILITSPSVLTTQLSSICTLPNLSILVDDFYLDLVKVLADRSANTARKVSETPKQPVISTGSVGLDKYLNRGIPTSYLTEIAGESASGKSHFLIQLMLIVQLPRIWGGLSKKAIYISTESGLATRRLYETLSTIQSHDKYPPEISALMSPDNIHVIKCFELEELSHFVNYQLPRALERDNYGLVVIDSIAPQFRTSYTFSSKDQASSYNTSALIFQLANQLKSLARKHKVAVVVANQTSDRFDRSVKLPGSQHRIPPMLMDHQIRWFTGWNQPSLTKVSYEGGGSGSSGSSSSADESSSSANHHHHQGGLEASSQLGGSSQIINPSHNTNAIQGAPPLFSRNLSRDISNIPSLQSSLFATTKKIPALGLLWSNAIDQRIVLKRFPTLVRDMENLQYRPSVARKLVVVFSDRADANLGGRGLNDVNQNDNGEDYGVAGAGIEFEIRYEGLVALGDELSQPRMDYDDNDNNDNDNNDDRVIFYNEELADNDDNSHGYQDINDAEENNGVIISEVDPVDEDDFIIGPNDDDYNDTGLLDNNQFDQEEDDVIYNDIVPDDEANEVYGEARFINNEEDLLAYHDADDHDLNNDDVIDDIYIDTKLSDSEELLDHHPKDYNGIVVDDNNDDDDDILEY